jgi:hypothetical protein
MQSLSSHRFERQTDLGSFEGELFNDLPARRWRLAPFSERSKLLTV